MSKKDFPGKIIVIVAPSGTGKSSLIKELRKEFLEIEESVSCTTRPIRVGEVHGVNYFYISKEEFIQRKNNGEFLEWALVHSNYYGTLKKTVEEMLSAGKVLLFDLDVQGADSFKDIFKEKAKIIFIEPPSLQELQARLEKRGTEKPEVIAERIRNAQKELLRKNDFDYLVLNEKFENTLQDLRSIFKAIILKK